MSSKLPNNWWLQRNPIRSPTLASFSVFTANAPEVTRRNLTSKRSVPAIRFARSWAFVLLVAVQPVMATDSRGGETRPANHLIDETSPYLLLHAYNPVEWYPWGTAALSRARTENKPIFLSVGYSTCYWCHVMERLVFSNPEIADLMNRWFVNIKVDREERPDLDKIYMLATQLVSGSGGWPNSVFLTPELKPFFAGTYFPPEDAHGRPSFPRVLESIHAAWETHREEVFAASEQLTGAIRELESGAREPPRDPDSALVTRTRFELEARYDARFGGFGGAPKFPSTMSLDFLLTSWMDTGDKTTWQVVEHSLEAMSHGGIYDHVGGGFHRYATDAQWRVPHFEKMLYNQAGLGRLYLRAFELSGRSSWGEVASDILDFVKGELTSPEGPFYSALDAETEAVEGKYYLWTAEEVRTVLADGEALFHRLFELAPVPETGGNAVVKKRRGTSDIAPSPDELRRLKDMRQRLLEVRSRRVYPLRDDKIITSWNGLMIETYAYAFRVLKDQAYQRTAEAAAEFVLEHMQAPDGGFYRVYRNGRAKYPAYLEDYAFLARGLLSLHRAGNDERWLTAGKAVVDQMLGRFWDADAGGFYYTEGGADLLVRIKDGQDSALPSANAVAVDVLLDLAEVTGDNAYRERAARCLRSFGGMMQAQPQGFIRMIAAADRYLKSQPKSFPAAFAGISPPPLTEPVVQARLRTETTAPIPGHAFALSVDLSIQPGWHVNAYAPSARTLRPTSMTLNSDLPLTVLDTTYPASQPFYYEALDETLNVYQGEVSLGAQLRLQPHAPTGAAGVIRVLIQYQACDDTRCLPPGELQKTVPISVGTRTD